MLLTCNYTAQLSYVNERGYSTLQGLSNVTVASQASLDGAPD